MSMLLLSEAAASTISKHNQAFISEGDIMHNVFGMHEHFHSVYAKARLHLMLFLDCSKGFNRLSHVWLRRVFQKCQLPKHLQRAIYRLVEEQKAFLVFA